ncbi:unnamed protein product [Parajaminaea phylloscopi]
MAPPPPPGHLPVPAIPPPSSSPSPASSTGSASAEAVASAVLNAFSVTLDEIESYIHGIDVRIRCEDDYVRALRSTLDRNRDHEAKLDARIGAMASSLPGASNLPNARKAWRELQQGTLEEADTRASFADSLRATVLAPLRQFHEGQERIRRRVRDDIKGSLSDYDDMRHVHLKRVRKAYDKACENVEALKAQQQAAEEQRLLLSPPPMRQHAADSSEALWTSSDDRSSFGSASPKRSASFGRNRHHHHQPSLSSSASSPRDHDNMATSPPNDGAAMSKKTPAAFFEAIKSRENWDHARREAAKKTNALISKMRDGAAPHNGAAYPQQTPSSPLLGAADTAGLQHSTSMSHKHAQFAQSMAIKLSKAKREAADADKAYRKAVFDVETLSLRREKTLTAARSSVLDCRRQLFHLCSDSWRALLRSAHAVASSQVGLARDTEQLLASLRESHNLEHELSVVDARLPFLDKTIGSQDGPVTYVNYWHGEYRSLLFGVSLVDYDFARAQRGAPHLGPPPVEPPLIARKCIAFIEEHALDHPGIYRTSAKHTAVQQLAADFEKDEFRFQFDPLHDEPAAVAGVLKQWLRDLPQPVMAMPWEERIKLTHSLEDQLANGFAALKGRIRRLPPIHQVTLRSIVEHLAKVAAHSSTNKMTAKNLSVVFGPVLLSEGDPPSAPSGPTGGLGAVSQVLSGAGLNGVGSLGGAANTNPAVSADGMSLAAAMEEDNVCEILIEYCSDIFALEKSGAPVVPWNPTSTGAPLAIDLAPTEAAAGDDVASSDAAPPAPSKNGQSGAAEGEDQPPAALNRVMSDNRSSRSAIGHVLPPIDTDASETFRDAAISSDI